MVCSGCGQEIGERKAYTHDRGRVYHPGCAPSADFERGYRAGIEAAAQSVGNMSREVFFEEGPDYVADQILALTTATE